MVFILFSNAVQYAIVSLPRLHIITVNILRRKRMPKWNLMESTKPKVTGYWPVLKRQLICHTFKWSQFYMKLIVLLLKNFNEFFL